MKNPIGKSILFLIIGFLLLRGFAFLAQKTNPDGTLTFLMIDQKNIQAVLENRQNVDAIILGNSHGDDIEFSEMQTNGYQLSRAWGDFFETEYYLHYLVPKLPVVKTVFIPTAYFSFDWDNASVEKLKLRRAQMYSTVPAWSFIPGDLMNFLVGRGNQLFPFRTVLREDNWRGVFYALLRRDVSAASQPVEDECEVITEEALANHSETRAIEQIRFVEEIHSKRPAIQEDTFQAAVRITRYLQSHGIRVVFFTPPYYSKYTSAYFQGNPAGIQMMRDQIDRLQDELDVEYFDFSSDERFVMDHTLFKDSDHLNLCGRMLFSQTLAEALTVSKSRQ